MDFDIFNILLNIVVGFVIGFVIGMTGIGGGVLVMPALIHILNIPAVSAVGTGLAFALLTKLAGLVQHLRLRTIRKRTGLSFLAGSVPTIILSSLLLNYLSKTTDPDALNSIVQVIIGVVLLLTCAVMVLETFFVAKIDGKDGNPYYTPPKTFPRERKIKGMLAGSIIGILMGTTSIGGGVLIIPLLIRFFGLSVHDVVGTSIMISVVLAAAGGFVYLINCNLVVATVVLMTVGSLPGVFLGAKLAVKLPEKMLKFAMILLIIAAGMSLFFGVGE